MAHSKHKKLVLEKIEAEKTYALEEAVSLLKELSAKKFDESVDVAVNLGVDPRKSDQVIRGAAVLPNGTGKTVRVAVFAQGDLAEDAKSAGADVVGFDDLAEDIKAGQLDFDLLIAAPDAMATVGKLGKVLGPKGLMPNPKVGTVTADIAAAVKNAKAGQVRFRVDKGGIIHSSIGKLSFSSEALTENLATLLTTLNKIKPSAAKGIYMKKVTLSSTMGPGLRVDHTTLKLT